MKRINQALSNKLLALSKTFLILLIAYSLQLTANAQTYDVGQSNANVAQALANALSYPDSNYLKTSEVGSVVQGFDADLSTYAGITPSLNMITFLGSASFSAMRTNLSLVVGTNVQAYDADLTTYAGITPSANMQTFLASANFAAMRTNLSLVVGTNVQAYDADLSTYAGITPSANVQSILSAADYAAIRTALGLVIGTNVQAYDADLTSWGAITPAIYYDTLSMSIGVMDTVTTGDYPGVKISNNITITEVAAYTNTGTVTFNLEERAQTTPNTAGTDVMTSDLVADTDQQETGTFSNATLDRDDWLVMSVTSVSGDPTIFSVTIRYIKTN